MAIAVQTETSEARAVASAAARAFAIRGEFVVDTALAEALAGTPLSGLGESRAVVVAEQQRIEIVLDGAGAAVALAPAIAELAAAGWETCVLVPGIRLGEAHVALRGLPCSLQQWWWAGDVIRFGGFELP